eukprot:TRINITY_DN568_c0_g2_i3.p1 TRINITY_DN568_c0_g2~~TRINITY_DN568_c0_g2_i3.p1  ORF type:complete len:366 (+),score=62.12 TRINITY_DN568_c0_g2_i3:8-1105(+)
MSIMNIVKKKKKEDDSPQPPQRRSITSLGKWFGLKSTFRIRSKENGEEQTVFFPDEGPLYPLEDEELDHISKFNEKNTKSLIADTDGFTIEPNVVPNRDRYRLGNGLLDSIYECSFYCNFFHQKEHDNFIADDENGIGPIVISIESNHDDTIGGSRGIVRTRDGEKRVIIHGNRQRKKQALQNAAVRINNNALKFRLVKERALEKELYNLETQQIEFLTNYKFGVLFCISGQTENQMFSNGSAPNGSGNADFDEFLDFLGERITLQGWNSFRGGLDVKTNTTGDTSVFTRFHNCNIMFHVSTLLPFSTVDEQQVERKRHIGNDVLLLVFKQGDEPFCPNVITSNFNNIIVCVSKLTGPNGEVYYR